MNVLGTGVFLATIAIGYWVLTLADKEGNQNAKTGKLIGWGIIVISLIGLLIQMVPRGLFHGSYGRDHSWSSRSGNDYGSGHWGSGENRDGDDRSGSSGGN